MSGLWVMLGTLIIAGLAFLMGRQRRDDLTRCTGPASGLKPDTSLFGPNRGLQPAQNPPAMPPIKKPRLRMCGGCGKLCEHQHLVLFNCKATDMCNHL